VLASRYVGPRGKVFCFEPVPENVRHLKRHLELNRCGNTKVFVLALGERRGEAQFDNCGSFTGKLSPTGRLRVSVESLDGLLNAGSIGPADLVKIDVEGGELAVLHGGADFFQRYRPAIFLATHGDRVHRDCCRLLQQWDYALRPLLKEGSLCQADELLAIGKPA